MPLTANQSRCVSEILSSGFGNLPAAFGKQETDSLISKFESAFSSSDKKFESSDPKDWTRDQNGKVYAANRVDEFIKDFNEIWQRPELTEFIRLILGSGFGLVQADYFDKRSERTRSFPWHRDMTITVKENDLPSEDFVKPTFRAGIPQVEAPIQLLEKMLTLRIYLDPPTVDDEALVVKPNTHLVGEMEFDDDQVINSNVGDAFVMRPLLFRSTRSSKTATKTYSRVIHLKFAGQQDLWDKFECRTFVPCPQEDERH